MRKKKNPIIEIAEKYRNSGTPSCQHFGECGGCMFQDISYENQLLLKKEYLNQILSDLILVGDIFPAEPFHYRNRMDYVTAFGRKGLRRRRSFKSIVDVKICPLLQKRSQEVWSSIEEEFQSVRDYDYLKHEGYLRYVVLRQARFTGEVMASLVVADKSGSVDRLLDRLSGICDSVNLLYNPGKADLSFGEVFHTIGNPFITENFDGIKYNIYPNSFFQSNSQIAKEMYGKIRSETSGKTLDLCSGVGSISLFVATAAESVVGVEIVKESVESAKSNLALNDIKNVEFIESDAEVFMKEFDSRIDTLILDPPRPGLSEKTVREIERLSPEKIIYMSCNPVSFRENFLLMNSYEIESFSAYDMFPQTSHIETLAVLRKKASF